MIVSTIGKMRLSEVPRRQLAGVIIINRNKFKSINSDPASEQVSNSQGDLSYTDYHGNARK